MKKVLILPVHPPKIMDLIRFLHSCNQPGTHTSILLVCTNHTEATQIYSWVRSSACAIHLKIHMFVVDTWCTSVLNTDCLNYLTSNENSCVVNFKKFAALYHAHDVGYQFAVMIDVDTMCVGSLDDFMQGAQQAYVTEKFWGCRVSADAIGMGACTMSTQLLGEQAHVWCVQQDMLPIYNWFLQPPSYDLSHVSLMFDHMKITHGSLSNLFLKLSWFTFDDLVFTRWMAWQQHAQILDYSNILGINHVPEILTVQEILQLKYALGIRPVWLSTAAWLKDPELVPQLLPDCHMIYHVDRPQV